MKRNILLGIATLIISIGFLSCSPTTQIEPPFLDTPTTITSTTTKEEIVSAPTIVAEPTIRSVIDLTTFAYPILLLQTSINEFRYLNPKTGDSIPFNAPKANTMFPLRQNISPSGKLMLYPMNKNSRMIIDLITGSTIHTWAMKDLELFNPELAAAEAKPFVSELDFSDSVLLSAVKESYAESTQLFSWYENDRSLIFVEETGETSTNLFLYDHLTGRRTQLEDLPGLVENFALNADGKFILLKKGLIFQSGVNQDKHFYLLNIQDQKIQATELFPISENTSLSWVTEELIGVTDYITPFEMGGFSIININTLEIKDIFKENFSDLQRFGGFYLFIQREADPKETIFNLVNDRGDLIAREKLEGNCFLQFNNAKQALFQCEMKTFSLDQELRINPFFDSIKIISSAPNGNTFVMVNRSEQAFVLDSNLNLKYELKLEETPLEIQWHPDSSGFLYRTHGKLYYFDLLVQKSHLLFESDIFTDYTNLNAVWINLE